MAKRWWHNKDELIPRKDITLALSALRAHVENIGKTPEISLSHLGTYRQRELRKLQTVRVGEWVFGYRVDPLDESQGFYTRTLYIKLVGGLLHELNAAEWKQMMYAVSESAIDPGSKVWTEQVADDAICIRQPFAVTFLREGNPNIVTPSKELLLKAFDPCRVSPVDIQATKPQKPDNN